MKTSLALCFVVCLALPVLLEAADDKKSLQNTVKNLKKLTAALQKRSQRISPSKLSRLLGNDHNDDDNDNNYYNVDPVFYYLGSFSKEAQDVCEVDIFGAIFNDVTPVSLDDANNGVNTFKDSTSAVKEALQADPQTFATDVKNYLQSPDYSDADVIGKVNDTIATIEKTLIPVWKGLFCAEVGLVIQRARISLFGATGFVNGDLCNRVSVELMQFSYDASKVMKAIEDGTFDLKTYVGYWAGDVECHEGVLGYLDKVVNRDPFTSTDYVQLAAETQDFFIGYGLVLQYEVDVIVAERDFLTQIAGQTNNNNNNQAKEENDENLGAQLQKLLDKLNDLSAKKKAAAESAVAEKMPSMAEKIAIKKSYYAGRRGQEGTGLD